MGRAAVFPAESGLGPRVGLLGGHSAGEWCESVEGPGLEMNNQATHRRGAQ